MPKLVPISHRELARKLRRAGFVEIRTSRPPPSGLAIFHPPSSIFIFSLCPPSPVTRHPSPVTRQKCLRTRLRTVLWVTERITSPRECIRSTTEMTGTNCILDAARNGPERQRQLLIKEKLAAENPSSHLTAHANGRPFHCPSMTPCARFTP